MRNQKRQIQMPTVGHDGALSKIAKQTFGRINTTVSITIASHVSTFLAVSLPRNLLILVSIVVFILLVVFKQTKGLIGTALRPVTTAKSVMGIVVTTTIMRSISDMGSASVSYSGSSASYRLLSAVILGTCFVLGMGCLPDRLRTTPEGNAM